MSDWPRVLVDTSAWIEFLKLRRSRVDDTLAALIDQGVIVVTDIVLAEVTYGARDDAQFKKYLRRFSAVPFVYFDAKEDTLDFCEFRFSLRAKGLVTTYTDAMIAWIAIANNCQLLTLDVDFERISELSKLRLFRF